MRADYLVIEIRVENLDGSEITKEQLRVANEELNICCSKLETRKAGYISAALYSGEEPVSVEDIL